VYAEQRKVERRLGTKVLASFSMAPETGEGGFVKSFAVVATIAACVPVEAVAGNESSTIHPGNRYSNNTATASPGGRYHDLVMQVQRRLDYWGFDAGPADGTFNLKTQTALRQFQRHYALPVSGAIDDDTLRALGVFRAPTAEEGPG
jgi:hypothetical protein